MKRCPICEGRYPDDFDTCKACEVPLIDNEIVKETLRYGANNKKLLKKYPKECQIYLETQAKVQAKIQKERQAYEEKYKVTISQSAMPTKSKPEIEDLNVNIPKCPTCGSTNVRLISSGKKALGFITVGIFSSNFGKSYECDDCKYKW